jgi:hypothetical protein
MVGNRSTMDQNELKKNEILIYLCGLTCSATGKTYLKKEKKIVIISTQEK